MGTFTDNLLKITEFPFSYSFIGVLVLIAGGKGLLSEELSLASLGPLLILIGFIATTLSISDPIGRLQKAVLVRGEGFKVEERKYLRPTPAIKKNPEIYGIRKRVLDDRYSKLKMLESENENAKLPEETRIENELVLKTERKQIDDERKTLENYPLAHLLAYMRIFGPQFQDLINREQNPMHVVMCLLSNFHDYMNNNGVSILLHEYWPNNVSEKLNHEDEETLAVKIRSRRYSEKYEDRPSNVFEQLKDEDRETLAVKISSLKRKTVGTIWVTREIDKITSMAYFIIVVATFTYAVLFVPNVANEFLDTFQDTESVQNEQTQDSEDAAARDWHILTAKIIIGAFSFVALGVVLTILIKRRRELASKSLITFKFLILQNAIKIKRDIFDKRLEEIRQFLVEGDWTLADVEVERLMEEYDDLVRREWIEKKVRGEEIKNVGNNKVNYQDLGIY